MNTSTRRPLDGPVTVGITRWDDDGAALDWAADEAAARASSLHVLHVTSGHEIADEAVRRAEARHPGLPVTTALVTGDPTQELVRASERAATLVVGARRPGWVTDRLVGSAPETLATRARCPVVIVSEPVATRHGPVLVGLDPETTPPSVLHFAFDHAARHHLGVRLVHARAPRKTLNFFRVERALDATADQQAMRVEQIVTAWTDRYPDVPVDVREARVHPVQALTRDAAGASLVVVASRRRPTGDRLGPTSRGILHHVPVLAVVNAYSAKLQAPAR